MGKQSRVLRNLQKQVHHFMSPLRSVLLTKRYWSAGERAMLRREWPYMPNRPRYPRTDNTVCPVPELCLENDLEGKEWVGNNPEVNPDPHLHGPRDWRDHRYDAYTYFGAWHGRLRSKKTKEWKTLAFNLILRNMRIYIAHPTATGLIAQAIAIAWPSHSAIPYFPDFPWHEHVLFRGDTARWRWEQEVFSGHVAYEKHIICPRCSFDNRCSHTHCRSARCGYDLRGLPPSCYRWFTRWELADRARFMANRRDHSQWNREDLNLLEYNAEGHPYPYVLGMEERRFPSSTRHTKQ